MGLSKAAVFKQGLQALTCSTAIIFDDIINGNVTTDGLHFFVGLT
jgi:hypothetical protein